MLTFKKIGFALAGIVALAGVALAQTGFWGNWPIVNGSSYCASSTNGVCTSTIPAGPALTGNEQVPANAGSTTQPSSVLIPMAALNALPITVSAGTLTTGVSFISASNVTGGYLLTGSATISQINLSLPASPLNKQQFRISANRTITTLNVFAGAGSSMGANSNPTVMTASTTVPQGYTFMYNSADTSWYRLQ